MSKKTGSLGLDIIRALGLPENGQKMEIIFDGSNLPRVKYEFIVEPGQNDDDIVRKFEEYELRKIERS